jgi:hypothetical protein
MNILFIVLLGKREMCFVRARLPFPICETRSKRTRILYTCTRVSHMDILNHFIYFMTCEMRWRMPLLSVTIELIIYTLKRVFY